MSRQNLHTDTTAPGHGAASRGTCPEGHHKTDSADHEHEHSHSCGCGHDHRHHHDDSAECDHDHHHHHDDSCGCGYDHHHHGDSCGCGHDHHHDDDSCGRGHDHHHHGDSCGCGHDHGDAQPPHTEMPSAYKGKARIFLLENLGCAHCAAQMEEKIQKLPGVHFADITYTTRQLRIAADDTQALIPKIAEICTSIEPDVKVVAKDPRPSAVHAKENKSFWQANGELITLIAGAVLFLAGEVLSHLPVSLPGGISLALFLAAYLCLGFDVLKTAVKNLFKGRIFDENFLMSIATIGAFLIGEYGEAAGVMLFYRIGEFFEEKAVERSRAQIMDAVDLRPETVLLIDGNATEEIPAENARPGDLVLVRPGDRIPLDSRIVNGSSQLDTSAITGEPVPVTVKPGDSVSSGCVNLNGTLTLSVEKPLEDSLVSRILDAVENAAASKPKMDRFITRFSRYYTPIVLLIALATAVIPSLVTGDWSHWVYTALTFLVISCPCALVLSVPLAFFSGIGAGSKLGILFKGGASLEMLKDVKAVIMDKTGTITQGNFLVQQVLPAGSEDSDSLLALTASCEQNSSHPIAVSIVKAARERQLALDKPDELEEIAGHGIRAVFGSDTVLCGNRKLMDRFGVAFPEPSSDGFGSEVFVAKNGTYSGTIRISDTIKADAKDAITQLNVRNITTVMLTGDSENNANAVAKQVGVQKVFARLLPQEKLSRLQQIRREYGSVMFVGDGINDAPVLAGADVGAAMGSGADAAIEAADVVFMTSSVEAIPQALAISRATGAIAMQNVIFALGIKIIVMILGLFGFASMWLAVFADSGVAMLCVLNAIRILYSSSFAKKSL